MSREMRFSGRTYAVIGGAGGIGAHLCQSLMEQGGTVFCLDIAHPGDRDQDSTFLEINVRSESSIQQAVAEIYRQTDAPVNLINCAGVVENDIAAEEMPADEFDRVMGVNLRGVFLACREFGRELLARGGGSIVNVASMSGNHVVNAPQRQSVYNSSKAGVAALTRSLAVEWGGRNVRVNCVSPGYVDTPLNALKKHMHGSWMEGTVLGRFATLSEVTGAIEYLLSDEAGYCCGTELLLDGGSSLR